MTSPLDQNSQKFLDFIRYIVTPQEEKIFREMPPEDRHEFVIDFWKRRDPDPNIGEDGTAPPKWLMANSTVPMRVENVQHGTTAITINPQIDRSITDSPVGHARSGTTNSFEVQRLIA